MHVGNWFRISMFLGAALFLNGVAGSALGEDAKLTEPLRLLPRLLKPAEHGVGRLVPDLTMTDITGKALRLSDFAKHKALVIALTSTTCPLSKKYAPSLARLEKTYRGKEVAFLLVNPVATDKREAIQAAIASSGLTAPYVHDDKGTVARALGTAATTDVFVLDTARTVVYHGAVDDQYGLGYALETPRHTYLVDALDALLAGREPTIQATETPGCLLEFGEARAPAAAPTYHNRISRILQNNCVECHRDGGVAPFSLDNLDDVKAHKGTIARVIERGIMPPWFAAPPAKGEHTPWANDRSLASADKTDLLAWLAKGTPAGDRADAPRPRVFPKGWQIGEPDKVFQISHPIDVKAEGTMPYQIATVATDLAEDKWVQAVEVQPTAREVVHHILVFAVNRGEGARQRLRGEGGREGFFAIYVPGNSALIYPEGFAKRLPKGATLAFQIHYTPNGAATKDQTRIGVIFAKKPPEHEVHVAGVSNHRISIPPGASNHAETAKLVVPADVRLLAFLPHMHLRGKDFRYEAELPGGKKSLLLDVPRYDFNWQLCYRFAEPVDVPRGSTLKVTAHYDNSKDNPANPDPTRTVYWGKQTTDEMLLGYVEYYQVERKPAQKP